MKVRTIRLIACVLVLLPTPVFASDPKEEIEQSCRVGYEPIIEAMGISPLGSVQKQEVLDREVDAYCACFAEAMPVSDISSENLRYYRYLLEEASTDRGATEQKLHLAWHGIEEEKMGLLALNMLPWVAKCDKDKRQTP